MELMPQTSKVILERTVSVTLEVCCKWYWEFTATENKKNLYELERKQISKNSLECSLNYRQRIMLWAKKGAAFGFYN